MKNVYEFFQREADIFDGEGYVPIKKDEYKLPSTKAWITKDIITGEMSGGNDGWSVPIHPSYWNWFADKVYTEMDVEIVAAKIFGNQKPDGTFYCDYCCNGDRCDDPTHTPRHKCKHCNGTGSIPTNMYIVPVGTRTKLVALSLNNEPNPNNGLKNARIRREERKIVEAVVKEFDPKTREEWITLVIPTIIKQVKELSNEPDKGSN